MPEPDKPAPPAGASPSRIPEALRALQHPNYRRFMSGQAFSLMGGWVQTTAQQWLVYTLTGNAFLLGLVGFAAQFPVLVFGPWAGIVADRTNRLNLIRLTQVLCMGQALVLAVLTLAPGGGGRPFVTYWHLLALSLFAGIVQAFDLPARQAFLVEMVPRKDLGNAVAINSLSFNCARVIGPVAAGVIIALFDRINPDRKGFGEGACFLLNGLSFTAVLVQLSRMRIPPGERPAVPALGMEAVREALRYVGGQTHQMALLIYVGVAALFALPYLLLMPVFAKDVFRGDAQTSAQLMSSIGIGAMIGGVVMARRRKIRGLGRHVALATLGFAAAAASFAVMEDLGAARLALVAAGCCMVMAMIGAQTLVQTLVADEFRGRVMSFYTMMSLGLMPFGNLLTGLEAKLVGPRWAMGICSAVSALAGLALLAGMPVIRKSARATREYARIMEMP